MESKNLCIDCSTSEHCVLNDGEGVMTECRYYIKKMEERGQGMKIGIVSTYLETVQQTIDILTEIANNLQKVTETHTILLKHFDAKLTRLENEIEELKKR